jgi:hypothetical protein
MSSEDGLECLCADIAVVEVRQRGDVGRLHSLLEGSAMPGRYIGTAVLVHRRCFRLGLKRATRHYDLDQAPMLCD